MVGSRSNNRIKYTNFGLSWFSQAIASVVLYAVASLAPILRSDLTLSRTEIGTIVGVTYVGISMASILFGSIGSYSGVRRLLILGQLIEGASVIAASFAQNFGELCIAFFGVGIGYSAITPATTKSVVDWFSYEKRGSLIGLKQTGTTIGGIVAGSLLPLIAVMTNFRGGFLAAGAALIIGSSLLIAYRDVPKPPRSMVTSEENKNRPQTLRKMIHLAMTNRLILFVGVIGAIFVAVQNAILSYTTLFLQDTMGFGPVLAGFSLAAINVAGAIGRPIFGAVSDGPFHGDRILTMFVIACFSSGVLGVVSLATKAIVTEELIVILIFLGLCALGWNGVFLTLAAETAGEGFETIGTSVAFGVAMTGTIVGVPLFGGIVDAGYGYDTGWRIYALVLIVMTSLFMYIRKRGKKTLVSNQ